MKHLFIINPVAGKGKTSDVLPKIQRVFKNRNDECIIEFTKNPGHATEIARRYSSEGVDRIYSVGGDGTLNEVLNGMAFSNSSLAVIPSGSGNDFFRSICSNSDTHNIIERTVAGKEKAIDLARINERYFLNISSLGFDAEVVFSSNRIKRLPLVSGSLAYVLAIFTSIFKCKCHTVKIDIDGKKIEEKILLIAFANGKFYGGGMLPTPEAKIDDGLLDICLIEEAGRLKILGLFPKYMKGRHETIKEVHFYKGKNISISCDVEIPINIDGEISILKEARFEVIPKAINFVIPL